MTDATTAKKYAKWCLMLIEGEEYIWDDIYPTLFNDGFIDKDGEWIIEDNESD